MHGITSWQGDSPAQANNGAWIGLEFTSDSQSTNYKSDTPTTKPPLPKLVHVYGHHHLKSQKPIFTKLRIIKWHFTSLSHIISKSCPICAAENARLSTLQMQFATQAVTCEILTKQLLVGTPRLLRFSPMSTLTPTQIIYKYQLLLNVS